MEETTTTQILGILVLVLLLAKVCGSIAKRLGQPSVLGELLAGVILGVSWLNIVDPHVSVLHFLSELGVMILLFEIGLETDLKQLLKVGGSSFVVACVGVALPFMLGYLVCSWLGYPSLVSIVAGATLTATSVGITARVLSDLNRLSAPESQIILGAAVIDDIIGLVILAVIKKLTSGEEVTSLLVVQTTASAFGFLLLTLTLGSLLLPPVVNWIERSRFAGTPTLMAMICVMGLAWAADGAGSAMIIGAFAAGLLLRKTEAAHAIEHGVAQLGQFFVPIFFVCVGASVDVSVLNPFNPSNLATLRIGGLLILAAIVGKFLCGYSLFWFKGRKDVIGIGMIPRGEVGLIFAQSGLDTQVFDTGLFSAATIMVMVTTFVAPPLLRLRFPPLPDEGPHEQQGIESLVN
ncbi:MAG: cation:proton antiporter [Pirellulaceae bacterium]|nr:cation:proton antiporter [Pirellulaceae bacterium]